MKSPIPCLCAIALTIFFIFSVVAQPQAAFQSGTDNAAQWTTFARPIKRVAVIGAGPSGLQAATHLLAANLTVRLFERAPAPGGKWFYTDETPVREQYPETEESPIPEKIPENFPATQYYTEGEGSISLEERWREHWNPRPMWSDLLANSPSEATKLPGIEYPPDAPCLVSVHDVQRNVRAYASLHGLNTNDNPASTSESPLFPPITSYATRVEAIRKSKPNASGSKTETWTLTLRRLSWLRESNRLKAEWWEEEFDAVVVATGIYTKAKIPEIKGIGNWSKAVEDGKYSIYHAQSFRNPKRYAGKTVLIVGSFISGTYISRSIAPYVDKLLISARPNRHHDAYGLDIMLHVPTQTEIVPEISSFEPLEHASVGIKAGIIHLLNGSAISGIDEIIFATGYHTETFLPELVNPRTLDSLHWTGHYIDDPTLAYAGILDDPWRHGDYVGHGYANVWTGKARLPSREQMWREMRSGRYDFGTPLDILKQEGLRRLYITWLNSESLELGGKLEYISHQDWVNFDNLPMSEWPRDGNLSRRVVSW
ncbi:dimethylaniline monooxygenase [Favolaschia claudopus]|uniref:Dimethylaniline monooxygenase n=1 Tax=Favolaschia claudopus TaxID=2862362 RepID=A0AAW0EKQ6_9AGAR